MWLKYLRLLLIRGNFTNSFQFYDIVLEKYFEYHIRYDSEDLPHKIVGVDSAIACQRFCQQEKLCNYVTYFIESGYCKLKASKSKRKVVYETISGKKYCGITSRGGKFRIWNIREKYRLQDNLWNIDFYIDSQRWIFLIIQGFMETSRKRSG